MTGTFSTRGEFCKSAPPPVKLAAATIPALKTMLRDQADVTRRLRAL